MRVPAAKANASSMSPQAVKMMSQRIPILSGISSSRQRTSSATPEIAPSRQCPRHKDAAAKNGVSKPTHDRSRIKRNYERTKTKKQGDDQFEARRSRCAAPNKQ